MNYILIPKPSCPDTKKGNERRDKTGRSFAPFQVIVRPSPNADRTRLAALG